MESVAAAAEAAAPAADDATASFAAAVAVAANAAFAADAPAANAADALGRLWRPGRGACEAESSRRCFRNRCRSRSAVVSRQDGEAAEYATSCP